MVTVWLRNVNIVRAFGFYELGRVLEAITLGNCCIGVHALATNTDEQFPGDFIHWWPVVQEFGSPHHTLSIAKAKTNSPPDTLTLSRVKVMGNPCLINFSKKAGFRPIVISGPS